MLIVQMPPEPRVEPQVPPDREKGAVTATVIPVTLLLPVLVSVRVWAVLVEFTVTFPNAKALGVTMAVVVTPPAPSWNSTAPASILASPLLGSGLGWPKKSVVGAPPKNGAVVASIKLLQGLRLTPQGTKWTAD